MRGIKADWFDGVVAQDDADPLGPPIERVAEIIEVGDTAKLNERLQSLMATEARLWDAQVTCAIRDRPDTCCSACPVRRTDPLERLYELCRVGVEQERVVTAMAVQRQAPDADQDAHAEPEG